MTRFGSVLDFIKMTILSEFFWQRIQIWKKIFCVCVCVCVWGEEGGGGNLFVCGGRKNLFVCVCGGGGGREGEAKEMYMNKFKWHFYSSWRITVPNYSEIDA